MGQVACSDGLGVATRWFWFTDALDGHAHEACAATRQCPGADGHRPKKAGHNKDIEDRCSQAGVMLITDPRPIEETRDRAVDGHGQEATNRADASFVDYGSHEITPWGTADANLGQAR